MTRNKENKGKMPRVTLDIMLNPTKIDEFGSWSRWSWRATRHGQEVSIATNSRKPLPKGIEHLHWTAWLVEHLPHPILTKREVRENARNICRHNDPFDTSQPLASTERQCSTGIVMILTTFLKQFYLLTLDTYGQFIVICPQRNLPNSSLVNSTIVFSSFKFLLKSISRLLIRDLIALISFWTSSGKWRPNRFNKTN